MQWWGTSIFQGAALWLEHGDYCGDAYHTCRTPRLHVMMLLMLIPMMLMILRMMMLRSAAGGYTNFAVLYGVANDDANDGDV